MPEEEVYRITLSIQNLARDNDFESIRLFGKILGTKANYLVVEAKLKIYPKGKAALKEGGLRVRLCVRWILVGWVFSCVS